MLITLAAAHAAPWTCVDAAEPADLHAYVDGAAPVKAEFDALIALLTPYQEAFADCVEDCSGGYSWTCYTADCTDDAGTRFVYDVTGDSESDTGTWTITPASGTESWTSLTISQTFHYVALSYAYTASWAGTVDAALPADASIDGVSRQVQWKPDQVVEEQAAWTDAACAWSTDWWLWAGDGAYEVQVGDHTLSLVEAEACEGAAYASTVTGTFDGAPTGQLDPADWSTIGPDEDGDGWAVEGGDPDDTDPAVHPCSEAVEEGDSGDEPDDAPPDDEPSGDDTDDPAGELGDTGSEASGSGKACGCDAGGAGGAWLAVSTLIGLLRRRARKGPRD